MFSSEFKQNIGFRKEKKAKIMETSKGQAADELCFK